MKRITAISLSLAWMAIFGMIAAFALFAAEDGAAAAVALFGIPIPAQGLETLPGRAVMGGLCFGATAVAAFFATTLAALLLGGGNETAPHTRFVNELAFGGAFGIAALVVLSLALASDGAPFFVSVVGLALLVGSFIAMREALAEPVIAPVAPTIVARDMAVAAAANVNVVRFPYYRVGGAA